MFPTGVMAFLGYLDTNPNVALPERLGMAG